MLNRFANVVVVAMFLPLGATPIAMADDGDVAPPPPPLDNGVVASDVPGIAHTPDGRTLTVVAKDETQLPIAPLTTSLSSREWLVGATFTGSGMGEVKGGSLEVGYQIGCGIEMDKIKLNGSIGVNLGNTSLSGAGVLGLPTGFTVPIQGQVEVEPRPGTITNVIVDKKTYKGNTTRVTVKDIHIKVDNCVGASSLRSYAVLTSSGTDADDIVAYYGVTKTF
jgi:MspA